MIDQRTIDRLVIAALDEDAPWGDLTSEALVPQDAFLNAELAACEAGAFSGSEAFAAAFRLVDPAVQVKLLIADGAHFEAGAVLATGVGPARAILRSERIGLNFVQRMSGIATQTARYVAAVTGTSARIVDTRKTTPGLRMLERQAVCDGGGHNHRSSLSDAVMVKDNHWAAVISTGLTVTEALIQMRERLPHATHVEVEVDRLDQIPAVLAAKLDTIMLDNFSLENLREGVALIDGAALVEASGGVNLNTVAEIATTGVDVISVGALTHSTRSLDRGLDVTPDL